MSSVGITLSTCHLVQWISYGYCTNLICVITDRILLLFLQTSNKTGVEIINTWHPNMTINFVEDYTPWTRGSVPAPLNECKFVC